MGGLHAVVGIWRYTLAGILNIHQDNILIYMTRESARAVYSNARIFVWFGLV